MTLAAGARLGPYEIVSALGAGGMGEVYRARDARLNRDVALKVLPEAFILDPDRLARFKREAQVLASLNHPNIAAIYGFEDSTPSPGSGQPAVQALVLELVEGPTLADRIAQRAIPPDEALPIARQIAEALEAAHEKGIIHRDLKPANIKLRPDGTVKVLDFGLAKAMEPISAPSADVTASPTFTSPAMTGMGVILGTAAYMSPEQAKGRQADKRSDVWAFGAVLYEMLSGQRAFKGDDISDTLAAVLRQDIDWTAFPASTPVSVRRLIARCLDRDVRRRLRDIGEARIVLDDPTSLAEGAVGGIPALAPPQPLWRRAIPVVLSVIVTGVLAIAATVYLIPSQAPLVVTRFPLMLGEGQTLPGATTRQAVAISPDGAQMAYLANGRLYLRSMSQLEARPIAGPAGPAGPTSTSSFVTSPVFSPDSQSVAFWSSADQTLKKVVVGGVAAVTICRADQPFGVSWGTDGIVFGQPDKGIMRVSANGGTPEVLVSVKDGEQVYGPQILPGGETVLFTLATGTAAERWDQAQIVTHSLRSGERKTLVDGGSDARYVPTGHLVYAVGGIVFAVPMDLRRLEVTDGPVPIVEGVRRANTITGAAQFDFSSTGTLVYLPGPISARTVQSQLALIDRKGGVELLKLPPGPYQHPRAAPNGTQIAFATDDGKEAIVWIYDLGGTASMRQLTLGGKNRFPIWSPDGQRVAFQSDREGDLGIFWQRADGSGAAERLTKADQGTSHVPESWSPKDERFLFGVTKGSSVSLWTFSLLDKKATQFGDVQSQSPINAAFSPDGRWVAYTVTERAGTGIHVQPFPATGAKYPVSKSTTVSPVWSRDGREIVSQPQGGLQAVQTITTQPSFSFGPPVLMRRGHNDSGRTSQRNYDVMPDGRILGVVAAGQTQSPEFTTPQIQVVLNWFEELKQRVPTK